MSIAGATIGRSRAPISPTQLHNRGLRTRYPTVEWTVATDRSPVASQDVVDDVQDDLEGMTRRRTQGAVMPDGVLDERPAWAMVGPIAMVVGPGGSNSGPSSRRLTS